MDIFDFRSQHNINTDGVFDGNVEQSDEFGRLFLRLKNLLFSELHTSWDIAYLEQYVTQKMVPRSLRWEVPPQKGDNDLEGWFTYFNATGVSFLQFLLAKKHDKPKSLNDEIISVKNKLGPFKEQDLYKQKSDQLRLFLEKKIMIKKSRKRKNIIEILLTIPKKWFSNGRSRLMTLWKVMRWVHIPQLHLCNLYLPYPLYCHRWVLHITEALMTIEVKPPGPIKEVIFLRDLRIIILTGKIINIRIIQEVGVTTLTSRLFPVALIPGSGGSYPL